MCGIAGFIQKSEPAPKWLENMKDAIAHRGPDGEGSWRAKIEDWHIELGHRRLSIIDLDHGAQPMHTSDGSHVITYNGEIFNFPQLRDKLERDRFKTSSDTEVVLEHYRMKGVEGIPELNGMFAFAIWDQEKKELLLARDRSGVKPLYYCELPAGGLAFASELSALLRHPDVNRQIDLDSLASFFFSDYVPPPSTILQGVRKLKPGHYVKWGSGQCSEERAYWQPSSAIVDPGKSEADLSDELRTRLEQAVERQMISDVPVGVFLSGGIDSSAVAALAAKLKSEPLLTFSIGFENKDFDESPHARLVAKQIGSKHVERILREEDVLNSLDDALNCLDEPVADPSILPTWVLSKLASEHVKVVLGGDGGDELCAGYPTYRAHQYAKLYAATPKSVHDKIISPTVARLPVSDRRWSLDWKLKRFVSRWEHSKLSRHLRWMANTDVPELRKAFPSWHHEPLALRTNWVPKIGDELNELLVLDFMTYLPGSVLAKVDRASMAHGLEVRPPFLDNELLAWSQQLPGKYKMKFGRSKYLLKAATASLIPPAIRNRPKKGFGIPVNRWLRGPFRERMVSILTDGPLWESKHVSQEYFAERFERHLGKKEDASKTLWALLVLDHWMKKEGIHEITTQ